MKKGLTLLVLLISLFGITACEKNIEKAESESKAQDVLEETENVKSNILVVYFSRTGANYNVGNIEIGNSAMMASYIKDYLKADSFEIVPVKKYSDDYETTTAEAQKEKEEKARPEIKDKIENFDDYDTIFIGYPIWWGDLPMIVYNFLESYNFNGKTVVPFNTHEGSGNAGTYETIKSKLPKANIKDGLALQGVVARTESGKNETINWLKKLGY